MKRIALLLGLTLLVAGCSSITGTRTLPDGTTLTVKSHRWFWSSEAITATTKDTTGFIFELNIGKSTTDATTLGAVAKGVAEGMAKGAMP